MKQSVSSLLAEAIEQRKRVTPSTYVVRKVKSTPEELAYEVPDDVSDDKKFPVIARGRKEWEQFLSVKRGYVRVRSELRKAFPTEESVNEALAFVVSIRQSPVVTAKAKRRKTA